MGKGGAKGKNGKKWKAAGEAEEKPKGGKAKGKSKGGKAPAAEEKRIDPENGGAYTFEEISLFYKGQFNKKACADYWETLKPVKGKKGSGKAKGAPAAFDEGPSPKEKRRDPEDGQVYTFEDWLSYYKEKLGKSFRKKVCLGIWEQKCEPVGKKAKGAARKEEASGGGFGVYVGNLDWNTSWQELKDHMRSAGDVKFADVPKNTKGKSKGYGIIEYARAADVKKAIKTLNDTQLGERDILVREDREAGAKDRGKGSKGKATSKGSSKGSKGKGKGKSKSKLQVGDDDKGKLIHVGNLSFEAAWQDVKDLFTKIGEVQYVEIAKGKGKSKGWGSVLFNKEKDAQKAIDDLNESDFQDRKLIVRMDKFL